MCPQIKLTKQLLEQQQYVLHTDTLYMEQEHQERQKVAEEEREAAALAAAQAAANSAAAAAAAATAGETVGAPAAAAPVRNANKVSKCAIMSAQPSF